MGKETEYIKRSDAIMAITRAKLPDKTTDGIPIANGKRSVTDCIRRLKEIRSEDVAPVVRCKDCKWCHAGYCEKYDDIIPFGCANKPWENWFCADGAKMDGER